MFELRVLNGLHQGATLPLIGEQWLIGAHADHDLALYDPGIAALHCRLSRTEAGWALDAEQSLINDAEGHALTTTVLTPNQTFVLGNVWLCLAPAEEAWPQVPMLVAPTRPPVHEPIAAPRPLPPPRVSRLKLACGVLAGLVVGAAGASWGLNRTVAAPAPAAVAQQSPPATAPAKPVQAPASDKINLTSRDEVRRRLSTLLSDRLLTEVSVEDSDDGLVLQGHLKDDALPIYTRMLKGFNERFASAVPVLDKVTAVGSGLPFAIVQIISGNNAHLVTADGHRMYIGDQLKGLRLTRLDEQHIEFDGDQHIEMHW
ncbi:FHA domain-containing protein [Pseudomonas sp. L1(2025)]|uniref:FHA domain-containing protein n=1 Tax=Pseudomonas sp. L1(2025) TaxID=3449429 RepID=UPI003F68C843